MEWILANQLLSGVLVLGGILLTAISLSVALPDIPPRGYVGPWN